MCDVVRWGANTRRRRRDFLYALQHFADLVLLEPEQPGIGAARGEQRLARPTLDDAAVLEHDHLGVFTTFDKK